MTRRLALLLPLMALATPALAGSKATFEGLPGPPMIIEVGDNGDARIGPGGQEDNYGLLIGKEFYLVSRENGEWKVGRITDYAAAMNRVIPSLFRNIFGAAADASKGGAARLKIVKTGSRTVVGFTGDVYAVTGLNSDKPTEVSEVVATQDPKLAPAGRALAGYNDAMMVMMAPMIGAMAEAEVAQNHAMAALGTPLSVKDGPHLTAFAEAAVDPSRLALPAKPQTVDQIAATMKVTPLNDK
jgi:hypothetical protein